MSDVSVSSFEDHFLARFGVIGSEEFRNDFLARFGVSGSSEKLEEQFCDISVERGDLLGRDRAILYLPIGYIV